MDMPTLRKMDKPVTRHGEPQYAEFHDDDRDLAMVNADMTTFLAACPCTCEAGCECDRDDWPLDEEGC